MSKATGAPASKATSATGRRERFVRRSPCAGGRRGTPPSPRAPRSPEAFEGRSERAAAPASTASTARAPSSRDRRAGPPRARRAGSTPWRARPRSRSRRDRPRDSRRKSTGTADPGRGGGVVPAQPARYAFQSHAATVSLWERRTGLSRWASSCIATRSARERTCRVPAEVVAVHLGAAGVAKDAAAREGAGVPFRGSSPATEGIRAALPWDGGGNGSPRKRRAQLERK